MELTTALSLIGITVATLVSFYFIHKPVRVARRLERIYNRLHWSDRV